MGMRTIRTRVTDEVFDALSERVSESGTLGAYVRDVLVQHVAPTVYAGPKPTAEQWGRLVVHCEKHGYPPKSMGISTRSALMAWAEKEGGFTP